MTNAELLFNLTIELQIAWKDKDVKRYNSIVTQIRKLKNI